MRGAVERLGIAWPTYSDWIAAAVAIAFVAAAWGTAWLVGRWLGPRLASFWEHRAGHRGEGLAARMCDLTRYSIAALIVALVLNADSWRPLGAIVLGVALAAWAAMLVSGLVRGLRMPRWVAALLAGVTFVALLARAVGGLKPITDTLDRVGFTAGATRISLLTVLQVLVTLVAIYAVVKLLNRNGPLDQAGRRHRRRRELRPCHQDRSPGRLDRHPRRQGASDPERESDDPGG